MILFPRVGLQMLVYDVEKLDLYQNLNSTLTLSPNLGMLGLFR